MKNVFAVIGILIAAYALSWAMCIGIFYLICLCFAWKFNLLVATGVWLILCLICSIFGKATKVKHDE